jgi:hypothetical protein
MTAVAAVALLAMGLAAPTFAQQAASSADGQAQAGSAPAAPAGSKRNPWANPLEVISKGVKLSTDPGEPAPFVKESRPEELNYKPVGGPRPQPAGRALSLDEMRAKEAELDAVRTDHARIAGHKTAKVAYNPIAQEPKKKPPKPEVKCVITCQVTGTIGRAR